MQQILNAIGPWRHKLPAILGIIVFTVLGLFGLRGYLKEKASEGWAEVPGKVLESRIEQSEKKSQKTSERRYRYEPVVLYQYEVDGKTRSGNSLVLNSNPLDTRTEAEELLEDFQVGNEVPVFFNPENPDESCLVRGGNGGTAMTLGMGLIGVLLSLKTFFFPKARE